MTEVNDMTARFFKGEPQEEITANTQDAAVEKHVPAVTADGDVLHVTVGDVEHPMLEEHYIQFIILETDKGFQMRMLGPGMAPKASFELDGAKAAAVYEFCNLHGLWKKEL